MALGQAIFSGISGAVGDLFAAEAYKSKAKGSRYEAEAARISARGQRLRAKGQLLEAEQYGLAEDLAEQNAEFSRVSTAIKVMQADRTILKTLGGQAADVAASGFAASGSALDIMRESAAQGALTKAVLGQQGLIEEAGYEEQVASFALMGEVSRLSAQYSELAAQGLEVTALAHEEAARSAEKQSVGATITGIIKGAGAVTTLFI